jgi:hypothetical protein
LDREKKVGLGWQWQWNWKGRNKKQNSSALFWWFVEKVCVHFIVVVAGGMAWGSEQAKRARPRHEGRWLLLERDVRSEHVAARKSVGVPRRVKLAGHMHDYAVAARRPHGIMEGEFGAAGRGQGQARVMRRAIATLQGSNSPRQGRKARGVPRGSTDAAGAAGACAPDCISYS